MTGPHLSPRPPATAALRRPTKLACRLAALATALFWGASALAAPDLLILNGRLPTVDGAASAIAITGERIEAVGTDAEIGKRRGPSTRVIDAQGRTVLPGFNDNHVHLLWGAESLTGPDLRGEPDLAAVQARLRAYAATRPAGAWIQGGGWHVGQAPGGAPTRQMLDAAVGDRPVVLWSLDRHSAWLNSRALQLAGITKATPDPPQGIIERDPNTGEPTGWLKEFTAIDLVARAIPARSQAERRALMTAAIREAHRFGVTAVTNTVGDPEELALLEGMRRAGTLDLRVTYAFGVWPGFSDVDYARYHAAWKAQPDTPLLKAGAVKLFLDGVPQSRTAFLLRPWGPQSETGQSVYDRAELQRLVRRFDADGWQILIHAMGDGAVRLALDSYESAATAQPAPPRGRRHRIEHAYLMDPADAPRFGKLGVIAAYQPVDQFRPPGPPSTVDAARPPQEGARWNMVRAQGGTISLGSDWPVYSMNALARIYGIAASPRADQRMALRPLLDAYTRDSAYTSFDEADQGALEAGKFADIVILSRDIVGAPPAIIQDLAVEMTIFNGRVVYQRATAP